MKIKRIIQSSIIVLAVLMPVTPAFAQSATPVMYIGSDTTTANLAGEISALGGSAYSFYNLNQASKELGMTINGTSLDSVELNASPSSLVVKLLGNHTTGATAMDTEGFADMLLIAGIYNANVTADIYNPDISIAEAVQANAVNAGSPNTTRIASMVKALNLYYTTAAATESTSKTSDIFFNIASEVMANPDLHLATNTIVVDSLKREDVTIPASLLSNLQSWAYTYATDGNNWGGFFRSVTVEATSTAVTYKYGTLLAAEKQPGIDPNQIVDRKIIGLFIVVILLAIIAFFLRRKKKNTLSTTNT